MGIYNGTREIKDILFRFADDLTLKRDGKDLCIKGFIYRKNTGADSNFYEIGRRDKDNEFSVAADSQLKKGDILKIHDKTLYISEVSPLCITDPEAGVSAKAVLIL